MDWKWLFFSDFAYSADDIYSTATDLIYTLKGMLDATKFESKETKEKYEKMLHRAKKIKKDIKGIFKSTFKLIKSDDSITDAEQRTLDNLKIYSDIGH